MSPGNYSEINKVVEINLAQVHHVFKGNYKN